MTIGEDGRLTTVVRSDAQIAREAEGKDVDWSYQMEQALTQFVASHPSATQFDITSIDCRQTYCELKAFAFDESAMTDWMQMAEDVKRQPWGQFGITGSSMGVVSGRVFARMTLYRRTPSS